MKEKRRIRTRRFFLFLFLAVFVAATVYVVYKMFNTDFEVLDSVVESVGITLNGIYLLSLSALVIPDVLFLTFFILSLKHKCKKYVYNGREIVIYSGWYHHYLKVDDEIEDEHNSHYSRIPIELWCNLNDGTELYASISPSNSIKLKINGKLYRK